MRRYLAIARLNAQLAFVNRLGLLLRVAGAMMGLAVGYYVWHTVFARQGTVGQFDWAQIKTYLLFASIFTILVSGESEVAYKISYGFIAVDLTRPLRLGLVRMAESAGQAVTELVMAVVLWVLAATLVGGLAMPSTLLGWTLLFFSLVWAVILKASIVHTWILVCFWTYNAYGVERLRYAVTAVLSGGIVPIALFPSWLRHTAEFLPFQGIVVTPAEVAIGRGGAGWALAAISVQAVWVAVLGLLATWLWRQGLRRVAIQGG